MLPTCLLGFRQFGFLARSDLRTFFDLFLTARRVHEAAFGLVESLGSFRISLTVIRFGFFAHGRLSSLPCGLGRSIAQPPTNRQSMPAEKPCRENPTPRKQS